VRAEDPKWCRGFPPPLRLSDRSEGDVREGNRSQRTSSCVPPAPLHLLYTRSATGAHNHQLVGAPDQGVRSNGPETWSHAVGRPLGSIQQAFDQCIMSRLVKATVMSLARFHMTSESNGRHFSSCQYVSSIHF
jgi:hypothetical protein